jgi:hypothetical protein
MDGVTQRLQRFQWFQRLQRLQPRTWRKVVILLTLLALVDGYLLVRAYVARNADTVVILVTHHSNEAPSGLEHTTLHYTGDTAHQIQRVIDTYPYYTDEQGHPLETCLPTFPHYDYQFTFLLAGIPVEVVDTDNDNCGWSRSILGLPERTTLASGNQLFAIYTITNGALPT